MPMLAPGADKRGGKVQPAAGGRGKANAMTGSLTARKALDDKPRPSILDTIKIKKPAKPAAPPRGRK